MAINQVINEYIIWSFDHTLSMHHKFRKRFILKHIQRTFNCLDETGLSTKLKIFSLTAINSPSLQGMLIPSVHLSLSILTYWLLIFSSDWVFYMIPWNLLSASSEKKTCASVLQRSTRWNLYRILVKILRNHVDNYWWKLQWQTCLEGKLLGERYAGRLTAYLIDIIPISRINDSR